MRSTTGVWIRANRLGLESLVVLLGIQAVAAVSVVIAPDAYRESSSVAPVLVVSSLVASAGAAVVAQPQPEELQDTASRSLVRWRTFSACWVLALVVWASWAAAAVLGDRWFAGPVLQSLCVGASLTLVAASVVPSHLAAIGVAAYVLACYFGGGRDTWNMVLHVQSCGWVLTWSLALMVAIGVFATRGPAARHPHDTD